MEGEGRRWGEGCDLNVRVVKRQGKLMRFTWWWNEEVLTGRVCRRVVLSFPASGTVPVGTAEPSGATRKKNKRRE